MTSRKRIGLAASLVLGTLAFAAVAAPVSAAWYGDGRWHDDDRWRHNNNNSYYYGYHYRLLYGQGPDAKGGAYSYLVNGHMIGGFGVIAWPVTYGETGVMTFIVNQDGEVYEQDLGPDTAQKAGNISAFNPDKGWEKADMTPP